MKTARRMLGKGLAAMAVLALVMAAPVQALGQDQDRDDPGKDGMSSADALLDVTLSCIATYDTFLARDSGDGLAKAGRSAAFDLYAELSGESDADMAVDIRQADADLPQWLAEDGDTLEDMRAGCDEAFVDDGGDEETLQQTI